MKEPAIYILTNPSHSTLYIGVTSNLAQRIDQHKKKLCNGFSRKYNCTKLVYFESFETMYEAICREKQLKSGSRKKKIQLIEGLNPNWDDLSTLSLS
ncbi:MAG: hypothetical protein COV52_08145 [Gammaproteobacteria bacterium CG11_big_fil_rev_8_21_14_0_20_46_22]|nr:MAG: hypothetical protein COW05_08900 [Gammaproteobacteria bacterium CG12_big_fil_rev_8_21_14_0_65_46_12]PIR10616.1 MAG: hypothetical protein COV52_08145 [Gammaproteobacteria bacterium CG11_big_fil_rev_8_21_14_0_20_46_22]